LARKKIGLEVPKFQNRGSRDNPKIGVELYFDRDLSDEFIDSLALEIRYRYNLDLELTSFYDRFAQDQVLGPIIDRWQGMRPGHPSSLYEYLIIGIVLQNATVRRSIQMFQALLEAYGTLLEYDNQRLWCFWEPGGLSQVSEEALRALKVGYRAKSIKRIDDQFARGEIDELELRKKDRETQMRALLNLYGVGPATVWYLLFDVFHHWDFFNHISPWEQKIYSKLFFDQDPDHPAPVQQLLAHFEKYGLYKQLAVHYIWEDLWWKRKTENIPWLEKLIRL
jgi:3-methyladenine DNA glycosylase/8-oxoguanine DNA glycosylase